MKTVVNEVLGFQIELRNIPETIAEAVQQAGSEQEVLNNHIDYVVFHSHNTVVRKECVELLEAKTGIKRSSHKEGENTVIDETEGAYVKRLRVSHADLLTEELAQEIRTKWSEVDFTPGTRGSGKLAKEWLSVYDQLKTLNKLEEFVSKNGLVLVGEEKQDKETVGRKAKELIEADTKARKAALLGTA